MRDASSVVDLGVGLAGATLSQLRVYPDLQVVGVEISEHLAAEAVRRAEMVGVADRFTMVVGEAVDYREDRDFDVGFWSQFFFAADKREAALQVLFDHVRSGGIVAAPGRWFDVETDPTGPIAQDYLLFRVLAQASDVPERDPAQLIAELESAGFTDPRVTRGGPSQFMVVVTRP